MKSLEDLKKIRDEVSKKIAMRERQNGYKVVVGMGTCGIAAGARPVLNAFAQEVVDRDLTTVTVLQSGCMGECMLEPTVCVTSPAGEKTVYGKVGVSEVTKIVEQHIIGGKPVTELLIENLK